MKNIFKQKNLKNLLVGFLAVSVFVSTSLFSIAESPADGEIKSVKIYDTTNDGKIDKIDLEVYSSSVCTGVDDWGNLEIEFPTDSAPLSFTKTSNNIEILGVEKILNKDFDDWQGGEIPEGGELATAGAGIDITKISKSEDKTTGDYAVELEIYDAVEGFGNLSMILDYNLETAGNGDEIQVTLQSKAPEGNTGSISIAVIYRVDFGEGREEHYNFVTEGWEGGFGPDHIFTQEISSVYSLIEIPSSVLPEASSGTISGVEFQVLFSGVNLGDKGLIDDLRILLNGVNEATNTDFSDWSFFPTGIDDWVVNFNANDEGIVREDTEKNTSDYAVKFANEETNIATLTQEITGLTEETYDLSFYAKGANSINVTLWGGTITWDGDKVSSATHKYDWSDGEWKEALWTTETKNFPTTGTYQKFTERISTSPSGNIVIEFTPNNGNDEVHYLDTVSLRAVYFNNLPTVFNEVEHSEGVCTITFDFSDFTDDIEVDTSKEAVLVKYLDDTAPAFSMLGAGNVDKFTTDPEYDGAEQQVEITDLAKPILTNVYFTNFYMAEGHSDYGFFTDENLMGKNSFMFFYSEPIQFDSTGEGGWVSESDTPHISTENFGAITEAGVLSGIVEWDSNIDFMTNKTDSNKILIVEPDQLVLVFNTEEDSFFLPNSDFGDFDDVYGNDLISPIATTFLKDLAGNFVNPDSSSINSEYEDMGLGGAWVTANTETVSDFSFTEKIGSDSAGFSWDAIEGTDYSTGQNFEYYMLAYAEGESADHTDSLWTSLNDENLAEIETATTTITGLSETNYSSIIYSVNLAGILSSASDLISFDLTPEPAPVQTPSSGGGVPLSFFQQMQEESAERAPYTPVEGVFSDTMSHWAKEVISILTKAKVIQGYPDGEFKPNNSINRAESAVLLCRTMGVEEIEAERNAFSDLKTGAWYEECVSKLKTLDLIEGYPDGTFRPSRDINRAEFTKLVIMAQAKYYEMINDRDMVYGITSPVMQFLDIDYENRNWYVLSIIQATYRQWIEGFECGEGRCFYPERNITRAEAVKILHKAFSEGRTKVF
jgi:hypothetical protein